MLSVLADPEDSITVANDCLEKDNIGYRFLRTWLGDGLVTADGELNIVN